MKKLSIFAIAALIALVSAQAFAGTWSLHTDFMPEQVESAGTWFSWLLAQLPG